MRPALLLAAALALPTTAMPGDIDPYVVPSWVRLHAVGDTLPLIEEAQAAEWDVVARRSGYIEVMMPAPEARQLTRIQRLRDTFGRPSDAPLREGSALESVEVLEADADAWLRRFADDAGVYHTYQEVEAELAAHVAARPELIHQESIGTTHEGRQILAVRITAPGDATARPSALITGLHHAREWISVEVPMALVDLLVTGYGEDPWVTQVLDTTEVWVVPVVNPDGHVYSQTKSRMWRKNRSQNSWWARGTDNNRNYGYKWGQGGASGNPHSQTYRGTEAFSEPETQAIRDLALRENFVTSLSFHSYSQLVLWPWGFTYDPTPDDAVLKHHGEKMAALTGYTPQQSSDLYPTSGDFTDWFYGATGALSYTFELGTRFVPPEEDVPGIVAKNLAATRYFLEHTVTGGFSSTTRGFVQRPRSVEDAGSPRAPRTGSRSLR